MTLQCYHLQSLTVNPKRIKTLSDLDKFDVNEFFLHSNNVNIQTDIVDKIDHRLNCGDSSSAVAMVCKTLNQSKNKYNISLYNRILNFPNLPTDIATKLLI